MNLMSRVLSGFFVASALLLTIASLSAEWVFDACTITDSCGNRISLLDAHRRGERLTCELQATMERIAVKEQIVGMVAEDEMGLIEAAAWFRSLHEKHGSPTNALCHKPGQSEGEGWCREVIAYAENKVRYEKSPSRADTLRQRLEAELQELLDCRGGVVLPD
jgi:hypothetical protein